MRKPEFVTFTGADDHTSVEDMAALSRRYPIEWGILFSPDRQGHDQRYPGPRAQHQLAWSGLRMAAHLCGQHTRKIMQGQSIVCDIPVDLGIFRRIQVNHAAPDARKIIEFRKGWGPRCIAQSRGEKFPSDTSIDWLHDQSGGRGVKPSAWPKHPGRLVGYAGGITPDNVLSVLVEIDATGSYWIDMESGVRTDDRFDLTKCAKVCEAVYGSGA